MSLNGVRIAGRAIPPDAKVLFDRGVVCLMLAINADFARRGLPQIPPAEVISVRLQAPDEVVLSLARPPSVDPGA